MGQSPQYNKRNKIKALYRDPFSFHTTTDHGGVNSSIGKQNGREPHLQKREIPEPPKELEEAGYKAVVMHVESMMIGSVIFQSLIDTRNGSGYYVDISTSKEPEALIECDSGYYGAGCIKSCSQHCAGKDNSCNHVNGTCDLGCDPGYQGDLCILADPREGKVDDSNVQHPSLFLLLLHLSLLLLLL
ncbi:hypothetical protein RRG08_062013 [Elysia crispata]|uniref:Uncharacterized protein n=1 Tax=Elysia crispata TaxID=231223 RepID=A0AAE1DRS7_9GAST|nr:hypothetical protein RRG08_062013 [Elysia crispata]